jgi:hypothetical protein
VTGLVLSAQPLRLDATVGFGALIKNIVLRFSAPCRKPPSLLFEANLFDGMIPGGT